MNRTTKVLVAAGALSVVWAWYRSARRLGYRRRLALLMFITPVNLILTVLSAFVEWPIERERREARERLESTTRDGRDII